MSDPNIQVSILTSAPPVGQAGFGVMLVVDESIFTGGDRVRAYETAKQASDDNDLTAFQQLAVARAFSQVPKPAVVKCGNKLAADADYEEALDACVSEDPGFYGVICASRVQTDQEDVAAWVLANDRLAVLQTSDQDLGDPGQSGDLQSVLNSASNDRAAVLYYTEGLTPDDEPADAGWMAQVLAVDPDTAVTTWQYKTIAGTPINKSLGVTERITAITKGANVYREFFGQGATDKGTLADGTFLDVRISADWLRSRCQEAYAQAFLDYSNRGSKIPYTDEGFQVFDQATRKILIQGEGAGHFIEGSHFVNMPKRRDVSDADVNNRILRFDFGAALAGAVGEVRVDGTISVDLDLIDNLAGR